MPRSRTKDTARLRAASRFLRPHARRLSIIVVLAVASATLAVSEPLLYRSIFDTFTRGTFASASVWLLALALVLVTRESCASLLELTVQKIRIALNADLLTETIDRLHTLPLDHHGGEPVASVLGRIERGVAGSVAAFSEVAFHLVPSVTYLALSAIVMMKLEWRLSLTVLAFAPLPALIGAWASREQTERERALVTKWVGAFGRLNEVLTGAAIVRSFVKEEDEKRRFLGGVAEANGIARRGVVRDAKLNASKNAVMALARVAAIVLGGALIVDGRTSVGTLIAFLGYVGGVFQPVQALTSTYQTVRKGRVSIESVTSVLGAPGALGDPPGAREARHLRGDVAFENVAFAYRLGPKVLTNVNLHVEAGERIALVGRSGAGKTTLMALLQRLYDPQGGRVLLDGHDLRTYAQRSLRSQIGVVLQEGVLFDDTIRDNIAFGRPSATHIEIENAARAAYAHDFIMKLPHGYDTRVGERGSLLSGGERQRIAIARALLKNAPILVLDEATSALDAEAEVEVQAALERLTRGRTTFVIAHRLGTLFDADRIAVVDGGTIAQLGTHDELLREGGLYANLVGIQTKQLRAA